MATIATLFTLGVGIVLWLTNKQDKATALGRRLEFLPNRSPEAGRVDDVFKVYLVVVSTLFSLVQKSPGLTDFSAFYLVVLVSLAIIFWVVGYVRFDHPSATALKLSGWLFAVNETSILYIFAVWREYLGFIQALGILDLHLLQFIVFVTVLPAVIVAWYLLSSVYPSRKSSDSIRY